MWEIHSVRLCVVCFQLLRCLSLMFLTALSSTPMAGWAVFSMSVSGQAGVSSFFVADRLVILAFGGDVGDAILLVWPLCFTTVQIEIVASVARSATPPIIKMTERRLSPKMNPSFSGFCSGYYGPTIGSTGSMIGCSGLTGSMTGSIGSTMGSTGSTIGSMTGSTGSTIGSMTGSTGSIGSGYSIWASQHAQSRVIKPS